MQWLLYYRASRQMAAMGSVLLGQTFGKLASGPPGARWAKSPWTLKPCWLSASATRAATQPKSGAVEEPKSTSSQSRPGSTPVHEGKQEDEPKLGTPPSLAGSTPVQEGKLEDEPLLGSPQSQAGSSLVHEAKLEDSLEADPLQDKSIGIVQRFKKTFKQYGKVMIPVHLLTSSVWFGTFYYAAMKGVNVVPFLEHIGFPEKLVNLLEHSQSGYAITAYAMYKIATPARYTVTLAGTSFSVKYLRRHGYMSTPPPVKDYIQDKMEETRERFSEKMEETKERLSERMEETKDKFTEKLQETKDKVSFRKKTD